MVSVAAAGLAFALPNRFIVLVQVRMQRARACVCRAPPQNTPSSPRLVQRLLPLSDMCGTDSRSPEEVSLSLPTLNTTSGPDSGTVGAGTTNTCTPTQINSPVIHAAPSAACTTAPPQQICQDEDCRGLPWGIAVSLCCPIARFAPWETNPRAHAGCFFRPTSEDLQVLLLYAKHAHRSLSDRRDFNPGHRQSIRVK